ncbi:crossover junction endonuclease MUS81 [Zerene cesonia]|uniref:crossover junction endonuclease MUS81 n=1 Tax=Zerene cesonia TaxID=33412 RepID=UPI0018E56AD6|nr:crossover junction endonuclease MUS81 [Zerene cesonia]
MKYVLVKKKTMNSPQGKRITYKRRRPNQYFEKCLKNLWLDAQAKKSKHEPMFRTALTSLSQYPLPLKSGADCAILKGFNKNICLYLDQYLKNCECISSKNSSEVINIDDNDPSSANEELEKVTDENQLVISPNQNERITYKPTFRSGGYGILMGLLEHSKKNTGIYLKKCELIEIAQKYCEDSLTVPRSVRYSAWSNMARLISKGLVKRVKHKNAEYSLTKDGTILANKLWEENKDKPSINNTIFHKSPPQETRSTTTCPLQEPIRKEKPYIRSNGDGSSDTESVSQLTTSIIKMEPNSFDIVLIIDKNETHGNSNTPDPFCVYTDLNYEARSLKVGDFTWIARHKTNGTELVLPYIVERKRMDDLGASIKDGRFHEQKFRLRKCGLDHVIYLIESYDKNKHVGLPLPTLLQALANTRIQDAFKVYATDSLVKTNRFLAMMTKRLEDEYKGKFLQGSSTDVANGMLMTFEYFNKSSIKSKVLTVTEMFIKMLLQLKGMSVEKALAITNVYKTPKSLITAYENCSQREGEFLLANLKYGDLNRNVGPNVSRAVFHLFTF